jgi:hypothetical protein
VKEITYLIYIVIYETLIWGGIGYSVFFLDHSGWWFLLAMMASGAAYTPYHWGIEGAGLPLKYLREKDNESNS